MTYECEEHKFKTKFPY